jgi:hypothetical protein
MSRPLVTTQELLSIHSLAGIGISTASDSLWQ